MGNQKKDRRRSPRRTPSRSRSRSQDRKKKLQSQSPKKSQHALQRQKKAEEKTLERKKHYETFDNPETQRLKNWKAAKSAKSVENPTIVNPVTLQASDPTNYIKHKQLPPQKLIPQKNLPQKYGSEPLINQIPTSSKSVNTRLKIKPHVNIQNTKLANNALPAQKTGSSNKKLFKFRKDNEEVVNRVATQDNAGFKNKLFSLKSKSKPEPAPSPDPSIKKRWFSKSGYDSNDENTPSPSKPKKVKKRKSYDGSNGSFMKRSVRRGVWNVAKVAIRKNDHWSKMFADNGINIDNINVDYVNADLIDVDGLGIENKFVKRTVAWLLK